MKLGLQGPQARLHARQASQVQWAHPGNIFGANSRRLVSDRAGTGSCSAATHGSNASRRCMQRARTVLCSAKSASYTVPKAERLEMEVAGQKVRAAAADLSVKRAVFGRPGPPLVGRYARACLMRAGTIAHAAAPGAGDGQRRGQHAACCGCACGCGCARARRLMRACSSQHPRLHAPAVRGRRSSSRRARSGGRPTAPLWPRWARR